MRQLNKTFNKEQFVFLLSSAAFATGLYFYLTSGPIPLTAGEPVSAQAAPSVLENIPDKPQDNVVFYVDDGKITGLTDPHTGELVDRGRKTPFAPSSDWRNAMPAKVALGPPPPPLPPPPPVADVKETKEDKKWNGENVKSKVKFMGVVIMNGQTVALLKPEDDSEVKKVKVGDKVEEYGYTVTKIEKQTIWVTDADNRPFILKDTALLTGEANASDESTDNADAPKVSKESKPVAATAAAVPDKSLADRTAKNAAKDEARKAARAARHLKDNPTKAF